MTSRKLCVGIASATLALGFGLAATPALAFDTVNWTWTLTRTDTSINTAMSDLSAITTGLTAVQARQIYLGDVHAEADGGASVLPSATPLDGATDLGRVEANAAAYANVYSASSETPLSVDMGQYHTGSVGPASGATPTLADPTAGNPNYAFADAMIADSGTGFLTPHDTTAMATAVDVVDATALAEARAVSNTVNLELAAPVAVLAGVDPSGGYVTNALMSADVTQLSTGLTDARATTGTTLNSASNMGALDRPVSSAASTSIGNFATVVSRVGSLSGF